MSLPTSYRAYVDCFDIFDKALEDQLGVRVKFDSTVEATHFRLRMHNARKLLRQMNSKIYQPDHPMYSCSPYDNLVIRVPSDGKGWLYVEKVVELTNTIEPLSKIEVVEEVKVEPPAKASFRRL